MRWAIVHPPYGPTILHKSTLGCMKLGSNSVYWLLGWFIGGLGTGGVGSTIRTIRAYPPSLGPFEVEDR